MTELEKLCEEALYEEVKSLTDGRSIVRDNASGKMFYKKRLVTYNTEVFSWLKTHKSRYVPRIEAFWQDGEELVVIEELIQGKTLLQILEEAEKGEGLPFEERIRILTELCDGLSFLHSAVPPIIHRDLKPSNIMLTEDGVVKIIDYDAAKLFVKGQKRDTQLIGTQGTAAPEQYGFAASEARTDIYALGKLIERMLPDNADAARIAARATNMDPARRYADAAQIREPIRRIRENPSGVDRLLEKLPGYDPVNRKHRFAARCMISLLCIGILFLAALLYRGYVIGPRERHEALSNAVKSLTDDYAEPGEIARSSQQLLSQWPYDRMDADEKRQIREIAKTMVWKCTSDRSGTKKETGLYLSDAGMDYLAGIGRFGVDEKTVREICISGQIQYCMRNKKWEAALNSLQYLEGLPDEEEEKEIVYAECVEASEAYTKKFQEQQTSANASGALDFYSQLLRAGHEEAEDLSGSFFDTVVSSADAKRKSGRYDDAKKLYGVLLEYADDMHRESFRQDLEESILESSYLKAQAEMDAGKYYGSRAAFTEIAEYKDAAEKADECAYLQARKFAAIGNFGKAASFYAEISGYKDADMLCLEAKYNYCTSVIEEPDDDAYAYVEDLIGAGCSGAGELRDKMYTWHAAVETGVSMLVGSEQVAAIRATLSGGPAGGATHIRFEVIDLENGKTSEWTSEEECTRGQSYTASYYLSSYTESIFEKEHTVNIYSDDGSRIGTWTGCFSLEFLKD